MRVIAPLLSLLLGLSGVNSDESGMTCENGQCTNDKETIYRALRNELWWLMENKNCNPIMIRLAFHVITLCICLFFLCIKDNVLLI